MSGAIPTTQGFEPDFSGTSPYSSEYQFDSVIFPTNAPLLAEDLNESQFILNDTLKLLVGSLLTNGVIKGSDVNWWSSKGVSIADGDAILVSAFGKLLYIKGPVAMEKEYVWCRFRKQIITSEYGNIDGLENYLAKNKFKVELSRRVKYVFDGLYNADTDDENYLSVKILSKGAPVYASIKLDSIQGQLLFNNFHGTKVTEDTTPYGEERITEVQKDIDGNLKATKVTVFSTDYNLITETLEIVGDKKYQKKTTFSVENGKDVIDSEYTII